MSIRIAFDREQIAEFCRRHRIRQLALFGSVLGDGFGPHSDVDVLVDFEPETRISLLDLARMQEELSLIFRREVDLVERSALRNPFRRQHILQTSETVFVA